MTTIEKIRRKMKKQLANEFELGPLDAAFQSLAQTRNQLRFNNFAYAIRELSRHVLIRLAPDSEVINCCWFRKEDPTKPDLITRAQRVKYAIQSGIEDNFIKNSLKIDLDPLNKRIKKTIELLNKYTHVERETFRMSSKTVDINAKKVLSTLISLFDNIGKCRRKICDQLAGAIDETILRHTLENTLPEVDMLATHANPGTTYLEHIRIEEITSQNLLISVEGAIEVRLQYGSDSDQKRGDGLVAREHYPFECSLVGEVNQLKRFRPLVDTMSVNTKSFYE